MIVQLTVVELGKVHFSHPRENLICTQVENNHAALSIRGGHRRVGVLT